MTSDASDLDTLDPDDPRPPSQRIASLLRAAIRTGKFEPGQRLPSQNELADRYGVARETVKSALRILRDERLIITRQGSGAFVRAQAERPVSLRPHIETTFEQPHVSIDFAGFSGETLAGILVEPLDKIRAGRLTPDSIRIRMLLPDLSIPVGLPVRADTGTDDPAIRERAHNIRRRAVEGISEAVRELVELGLIKSGDVETRTYATSPAFKLYILNGEEMFFGFYPVIRHEVTIDEQPVAILDPMGKDTALFHFAATDEDGLGQYVEQARTWFDSIWATIAHEPEK